MSCLPNRAPQVTKTDLWLWMRPDEQPQPPEYPDFPTPVDKLFFKHTGLTPNRFFQYDDTLTDLPTDQRWVEVSPYTGAFQVPLIPTGASPLQITDTENPSNPLGDHKGAEGSLFLVYINDSDPKLCGPLLMMDRGLIVKKDFMAGGFLNSGQGTLWLNYGLVGKPKLASPPAIQLMSSATSYPSGTQFPDISPDWYEDGQLFNLTSNYYWPRKSKTYPAGKYRWEGVGQNGDWVRGGLYTGNYDTLYLCKDNLTTPAHLDLGNLTVHGSIFLENAMLEALFNTSAFVSAFNARISSIVVGSALQFIDSILGINPSAVPSVGGLTVADGNSVKPNTDGHSTIGESTRMFQSMFTNDLVIGNYTAHAARYITLANVDSAGSDSGLILNFNTSSNHGAIVPDYENQTPNKTMNLGDTTHRWTNIYCTNLTADNINGITNLTVPGALTLGSGSAAITFTTGITSGTRYLIPNGDDKTVALGSSGHYLKYVDSEYVRADHLQHLDGTDWNFNWNGGTVTNLVHINCSTLYHLLLRNRFALIGDSNLHITNNAYYDGGFKYLITGQGAAKLQISSANALIYSVAPSGTQGNGIPFSDVLSVDSSGNLTIQGALFGSSGTLNIGTHAKISRANTVYFNVNSTNGNSVINLQRGDSTKGMFGTDGTKVYLNTSDGLNLEFDASGGIIYAKNDFVASGLLQINRASPVLNLCLANGDLKLDVGHDSASGNGFVNSRTGKLVLTGQGGTNDAFWFYGGHLSVRGGYHVIPEAYEGGYCGNSSHRWYGGYIRTVYTLGGGQYDMYDDLSIAKLWGEENPAWPSSYDPQKTKPQGNPFDFLKAKKENGEPDEYFNLNNLTSFAMCCIKASAKKHDEHDARFEALLQEIEALRSQIQQLKQTSG